MAQAALPRLVSCRSRRSSHGKSRGSVSASEGELRTVRCASNTMTFLNSRPNMRICRCRRIAGGCLRTLGA